MGTPFIRNYSSVDYGMHPRNYCITQDINGVIYVGNEYGLLEYDGSEWKQIHLPNGINATVVSIDDAGQIWLGSEEGIGYLKPAKTSSWSYQGLRLPEPTDAPFTVSGIHQLGEALFFTTEKQVVQYAKGASLGRFFSSEKSNIQFSAEWQGQLLLKSRSGDLMGINPDGSQDIVVEGLAPYELVDWLPFGEGALAVTASNGLWTVRRGQLTYFETDFDALIGQDRLTAAIALDNGNFAVGSYNNGVLVFDNNGRLIHHLSKDKGLSSNTVNFLFESSDQNLWVALDNGLAYIELNSAFTKYEESMGFSGMIYTSIVYQGQLYLGTTQGLFVADWEDSNPATGLQFKAVASISGQVWALHNAGGQLLCGHESGVFEIRGENAIRRSSSSRVWTFLESTKFDNTLWAGTLSGIQVFKREGSQYQLSHALKGFQESSRIMAEDRDGTLWVCHGNKGLFQLSVSAEVQEVKSQVMYEQNQVQGGLWFTSVTQSRKNGVLYTSNRGLYHFDKDEESFIPFTGNSLIPEGRSVNGVHEDQFGNLWVMVEGGLLLLKLQDDGSYQLLDEAYLSKARDVMIGSYEHIYVHDAQNVLIAAQNGVLHLDPSYFRQQHLAADPKPLPTLIRRVELTNPYDSTIFEGALSMERSESGEAESETQVLQLPYAMNSIRFTYASPNYTSDHAQQYQVALQEGGANPEWTSWTPLTRKEYSNLREGDYMFRVRGGNGTKNFNSEARFAFSISPPWHRTLGAYFTYALLLGGLVWGLVKIMEQRHDKEKQRLREAGQREMKERQLISEKEMMALKNAQLAEEIAFKNKEMASVVMQITQKNEFLMRLKSELKQISKSPQASVQRELLANIKEIERDMRLDKNWERFQFYFDQVHQDFLERLSAEFPQLSSTTLKLCAFIRIGLSTKEIAALMNISLSGVEKRRYRLRKKMGLDADVNMNTFLKNF